MGSVQIVLYIFIKGGNDVVAIIPVIVFKFSGTCRFHTTHIILFFSDLLESMRQAELCDWALDPLLFTSLCDSLNRFFTQKGLFDSTSGSPSMLAPPATLSLPPSAPPTLASLTNPFPWPCPCPCPCPSEFSLLMVYYYYARELV